MIRTVFIFKHISIIYNFVCLTMIACLNIFPFILLVLSMSAPLYLRNFTAIGCKLCEFTARSRYIKYLLLVHRLSSNGVLIVLGNQ